jgi:hypothetical protein
VGLWDGHAVVARLRGGEPCTSDGGPVALASAQPGGLAAGVGRPVDGALGYDAGAEPAENGFDIDTVQPPRLPPLYPARLRRRHARAVPGSKAGPDLQQDMLGKVASARAAEAAPEGAQEAVAAAGTPAER